VQNFLFTTKDEHAQLKAIDFGLSDFIKPGEFSHLLGYFLSPGCSVDLHCKFCGLCPLKADFGICLDSLNVGMTIYTG
jgi:hypothetical protein